MDAPIRHAAVILAWCGWALGLMALAVPRAIGLTVLRTVVLAAVGLGAWVALDDGVDTSLRVLAVSASLVAALVAFLPGTGELLVDGSSYGDEHRILLRAPTALIFGPIPLAWAVVMGTAVGGPLLLAARQWLVGAVVLGAGGVASRFLFLRLHQLSRRWLVFVPAGVVVHDPLTLTDPVLFPRRVVASLGPAPIDNPALDLTRGATGLALMLQTVDPVVVAPLGHGEPATPVGVDAILVTPTRPGHVLRIAKERRINVA